MVIILKVLSLIWVNFADYLFLSFREISSQKRSEPVDYSLAKCLGLWNQPDSFPRKIRIIVLHLGYLYLLVMCQLVIVEDLKKNSCLLEFFLFLIYSKDSVSPHLIIVSGIFHGIQGLINSFHNWAKNILSTCLVPDTLLDVVNTTVKKKKRYTKFPAPIELWGRQVNRNKWVHI